MAPRMKEVEDQFKNQINFIVVDGSSEKNYDLVSQSGCPARNPSVRAVQGRCKQGRDFESLLTRSR